MSMRGFKQDNSGNYCFAWTSLDESPPDTEAIFSVECCSDILEQHNIIKRTWRLFWLAWFVWNDVIRLCRHLHSNTDSIFLPSPKGDRYSGGSIPSEVKESLDGGWDAKVGPRQEVELRHGARLVRLQVLQVETAHQIVVAPDMLRYQMHLSGEGIIGSGNHKSVEV